MEIGLKFKDEGNTFFKAGDIQNALRKYHEAHLYLKGLQTSSQNPFLNMSGAGQKSGAGQLLEQEKVKEALNSCYLNLAACYVKLEKWQKCHDVCSKVIAVLDPPTDKDAPAPKETPAVTPSPALSKAYFRRAKAEMELKNYDKAKEDAVKALFHAPNDAEIRALVENLRKLVKEQNDMAAAKMKGFLKK